MAKESRGSVLSWKCALGTGVLCLLGFSSAQAAVGRMAGTFNVSSSGAATYSIPIFTPSGPRGVQPSVALVYNSNGGAGYLGRGWSLAGFSSISRCQHTFAQDGLGYNPVANGANDAFCLDGNRLRLQSGSYGSAGSVYATEIADFSRVTANGSTTTDYSQSGGPQSWTVERKDGTIYTYGGSGGSCVLVNTTLDVCSSWLVRQIQDRAGNKILFTYKTADSNTAGLTHPTKVEWTQTYASSGSYIYAMEFDYASDGNAPASSQNGYSVGNTKRDTDLLTSISVKNSGSTVRKYVLDYGTSTNTGAKRLTTVTECSDASATDCLSPTTIAYQNGQVGVGSSSYTQSTPVSAPNGRFDYNGDGFRDLTYRRSGAWYVRIANGSGGYGSEIATGVNDFNLMAGDPLGNGRDAIMGLNGTYTWHVNMWNGSGFTATDTGIYYWDSDDSIALLDVTGDGKDDMAYWAGGYLHIWFSTSTGSSPSFSHTISYVPYSPGIPPDWVPIAGDLSVRARGSDPWVLEDFDSYGDGRSDLIFDGFVTWSNGYTWFTGYYSAMYPGPYTVNAGPISHAKLNSDDCADPVGQFGALLSYCSSGGIPLSLAGSIVGVIDWNGDGRNDILEYIGGSTLFVQRSTGTGLASPESTAIPVGCSVFVTDSNGDGLADIGCLYSDGSLSVQLHNGALEPPDLAVSFTDGFGVTQSVSYVLSTHEGYTAYTSATYPQQDVTRPQILVRTATATDGIGGTYTRTYSYFGATRDSARQQYQGFEKIEIVDSRNSVKRVQHFERTFPYTGMLIEESSYQPGGTLMSSRTVTPATHTLDATAYNQRYFPYPGSSAESIYEVGGTKNGDLIQQTATSNTFDTSGNLTASTRTVTDKDSSSPLYNQYWIQATGLTISPDTSSNWCLGLPTASAVTSSSSLYWETSVTRSKSFTPDYAYCRHTAEDVEPSGGNRRVQTAYGFDAFGNINSVSVTGRNPNGSSMTARSSGISYGTTGQFPVSETNALSQTATRTFDSTFGSLLTETDPNGIVVSTNTYDTFGRVTRTTRADNTSTVYSYYTCATYSLCINGDASTGGGLDRTLVVVSERDTSDSQIRDAVRHLDMLDREIAVQARLVSGGYSRSGTRVRRVGEGFQRGTGVQQRQLYSILDYQQL